MLILVMENNFLTVVSLVTGVKVSKKFKLSRSLTIVMTLYPSIVLSIFCLIYPVLR